MEDVPAPNLLDVDRLRLDGQLHDAPAEQQIGVLRTQLEELAGYAQHLWKQVAAARTYLVEVLPDPEAAADATRLLTAPRGPADEDGWQRWRTAYSSLTSVLAGPKGDAGFGEHEARQEADRRRGPAHASQLSAQLLQAAQANEVVVAAGRDTWARSDDEPGHPHVQGEPARGTGSASPSSLPTGDATTAGSSPSTGAVGANAAADVAKQASRSLASLPAAIAAGALVVGYLLGRRGTRPSG